MVMKKLLYILFVISALLFTTCQKKPQLKIYKLEISEETIVVTPYSATITANYSYPGEIPQIKVYTSTSSSMSNAIETDAVLDGSTMTATIDNLAPDTKYFYRFRYSNGMKLVDTEIRNFTTEHAIIVPTLTTISAASITSNSAVSGGNISDDGGSGIIARGVCWNVESNPTTENEHTSNGTGTGGFISTLTNLEANTLYYVRAYATNGEGTGYGNEIIFITSASLATISTKTVADITDNSAKCGGNITDSGGMDITARGVCWNTEHNPTINDSHTSDGDGIGEFDSEITGLDANATYYVRAYATSNYGTSYGEEREFKTVIGMAVVTTNSVTGITALSAISGGNVVNDGGDDITARGVCWSTAQNPTVSNSHTSDGTGTGEFTSSITGLNNNVTYYVRAYATNSIGTAYGEERSFTTQEGLAVLTTNDVTNITAYSAVSGGEITDDGGYSITARGVCWSTSQNPTTNDSHTSDGTGTGSYTSSLTSLSFNTTYYVRAYATNSIGTSYGEEKVFTTSKLAPTVATDEVMSITSNSAVTGGNVTSDGGAYVTARGVCYSTSQDPTISGQHTSDGNGTGTFTSTLTGLTANTTYYVRAYATNETGISYGEQKQFTTDQELPHHPNGTLNGMFTVNENGDQVYFSQGNLQYQASTNTWRFAENQWDYVGGIMDGDIITYGTVYENGIQCDNALISPSYDGWIDLFGWGTSGYNHGAVCYQPWSTSQTSSDYYAYGDYQYNLYDQTGQADWGYNAISNGGNQTNLWRTLTVDEWQYVLDTRTTDSGIRFAKAIVNDVNVLILLPDDWSSSTYGLNDTNDGTVNFDSNTISTEQWQVLEDAGAVVLPVTGYRYGYEIRRLDEGAYWSASYYQIVSNTDNAGAMWFVFDMYGSHSFSIREDGHSVRLVRAVEK